MKSKTVKLMTVLFLGITANGFGQNTWLEEPEGSALAVEFLKPSFGDFVGDDLEFGFFTSATFLSGRFYAGENTKLLVELPIGHVDIEARNFDVQESETTIGNPYIGFETRNEPDLKSEFGVRLPLTSDKNLLAANYAANTDLDRSEAFIPDIATALLRIKVEKKLEPEGIARFKLGPTLWFNTADTEGEQFELFVDYSGQFGYAGAKLVLFLGITGRLLVSESNLSFAERTFHQIGVSASYQVNNFRPGVHIRIPADEDLSDVLESVFGINLMYMLD